MAPGLNEVNVVDQTPSESEGMSIAAVVYVSILFTLLIMSFVIMCIKISSYGQKTRSPQQRRMYVGSRARPSLGAHEPTVFVSPSNLPPPPKYECMAPPSYEEVVGIHYPNYPVQQPITQPIATALAAQSTQPTTVTQANETVTRSNDETVVVTINERPTVTSSS